MLGRSREFSLPSPSSEHLQKRKHLGEWGGVMGAAGQKPAVAQPPRHSSGRGRPSLLTEVSLASGK